MHVTLVPTLLKLLLLFSFDCRFAVTEHRTMNYLPAQSLAAFHYSTNNVNPVLSLAYCAGRDRGNSLFNNFTNYFRIPAPIGRALVLFFFRNLFQIPVEFSSPSGTFLFFPISNSSNIYAHRRWIFLKIKIVPLRSRPSALFSILLFFPALFRFLVLTRSR